MSFPDYGSFRKKKSFFKSFSCVNETYSDLFSEFFAVMNKMVSRNTIRLKNNTNEWFDGEIAEKNSR